MELDVVDQLLICLADQPRNVTMTMRPDNVNLPTLRGLLTTDDDAAVWVELDGLATLRSEDEPRVFVTAPV